jgi:pyruvate kinase
MDCLRRKEWVEVGTWLVVITNALADDKIIDTLQLRKLEADQDL